ncbi:MAG TPA: prolyl oligopeptidase family serine peptidase [Kofleriaceae bacterium]|nr:prolyl oligopeptidase family serine peptidase [Kofleriaceae bacterium]
MRKIEYTSSADHSSQAAMFYASGSKTPRPLLVALHTWSFDYTQPHSIPYAAWCIEKDWVFVHPNFRGPNNNPSATGSDLVVADILGAVEYAKANAAVSQVYLIGESGGGYAALLMAGRAPEVWAGVSAWVPVIDLSAWFQEASAMKLPYSDDIARSCGGAPTPGSPAEAECRRRSATTYLEKARGVPVDLNAGIHDGRDVDNPIPIRHSLHAFNLLADPADQLSDETIETMTRTASVPDALRFSGTDALYGDKRVLLRRQSGNARITLFDGEHEAIVRAGLTWLSLL